MNEKKVTSMLLDDKSEEKMSYDKRSHDERIADLKSASTELFSKAKQTGKVTDASIAKIIKHAKVHKDYLYKDKIKDKKIQQRYFAVRDDITKFRENFKKLSDSESPLSKEEERYEQEKERSINREQQLIKSREQVAGLYDQIATLKNKSKDKNDDLVRLSHQALQAGKQSKSNHVNFTNIKYISPDKYLRRNGVYCFDDLALRESAWSRSEKELHAALERNLPTRVYILIGPMCAGKTYWSNNAKSFWPDRHPVVIDSTNLSIFQRMKWFNIINQYIRTNDIHVCGVVFETPLDILLARNKNNEPGKKMPEATIKEKHNSMEWPDLKEEKFNEIVVIRNNL